MVYITYAYKRTRLCYRRCRVVSCEPSRVGDRDERRESIRRGVWPISLDRGSMWALSPTPSAKVCPWRAAEGGSNDLAEHYDCFSSQTL